MSTKTFNRRLETLIKDVNNHPHKDELIKLMEEQVQDDTNA